MVLEAYIVAAAKTILSPTQYESVSNLAASVVDNYLQIDLPQPQPSEIQQPGESVCHGIMLQAAMQQTMPAVQQPLPVDQQPVRTCSC